MEESLTVSQKVVGSSPIQVAKCFLRPKVRISVHQTGDASSNLAGSSTMAPSSNLPAAPVLTRGM